MTPSSAECGSHQHRQQHEALQRSPVSGGLGGFEPAGLLHQAHEKHAHERAEDHDAFQRQVDDAASLGKDAGQRHDHQGDGVDQRLSDQK